MVKINAIVSALLLGVAIALFTPVFSEIAMQFGNNNWIYAPYFATILEYLPIIMIAGAVLILVKPLATMQ